MCSKYAPEREIDFYRKVNIDLPSDIKKTIKEWKNKKGNLIPVLHKVQEHYGYVSREMAMVVAKELDTPVAKIYGVITFYHLFKLKKPGKHIVQVCTGTACYLTGAYDLIEELENVLGTGINSTTADGLFSLEMVRCVGCCGLAPVIVIGEEVFGNLKQEDVAQIIADKRNKEEGVSNEEV